jgi:hypothetical protein
MIKQLFEAFLKKKCCGMLRFLKTQSINTLKTIHKIVNKINYICNEHSTGPLHIPLHAIAGVFHPQPTPRQAIGKTVHFPQNFSTSQLNNFSTSQLLNFSTSQLLN